MQAHAENGMSPTYAPGARSQRRQRQNALAQRNYRARQRERRRILEQLAVSSWIGSAVPPMPPAAEVVHWQGRAGQAVASPPASSSAHALHLTASAFFACIGSYPEQERQTFFTLMTKELFGLRDIVKYGLIFLGYPVSASLYDNALHLPLRLWLQDVQQRLGRVDLVAAVQAGISLLGKLNVPREGGPPHARIHELAASPHHALAFARISFVSAIFENARHLGIPWCDLLSLASQSPFCRHRKQPTAQDGSDYLGSGSTRATYTPVDPAHPDLQPTPVQRTIRHHPTLDTIPWPRFRSRAIAAIHADPPSVDKEDFCLDLLNDGLRCWGWADGGDSALPTAAPWDARNWEAAPWFLEKWERLTDGRDGFEWTTSARWWSMGARTRA